MINLLPESRISQLRAAQHNTLLVRYIILGLISLVLVVAIHIFTYTMLKSAEDQGNRAAQENKAEIAKYSEVRETAKNYKTNLETAKALLDQNISYTTAIFNLSSYIPKNVILQNINLSPETIGKPITLSARAKSYNDGIALKDSLIKSDIASDASLVSIVDERGAGSQASNSNYPFSVSITVIFTDKLVQPKSQNTSSDKSTTSSSNKESQQ